MSTIVEAAAALDQGSAEVSPLPDSRPSTPSSENDVRSTELPLHDTDIVIETSNGDGSASDSHYIGESTSDAVNIESAVDKIVCAAPANNSHASDDLSTSTANSDTEKITPEDSASVFIKSESANISDGIRGTDIDINPNTSPATNEVENACPKTDAMGSTSTCKSKETIDEDDDESAVSTKPDNIKCMDQFDKANTGDVIGHYFTRCSRQRALSPVQEDHTYQLATNSDLWIKIKNAEGPDFVFEVDSAALAAHSPVFSTMAYKTHTRGNQETWAWELEGDSIGGLSVMFSLLHLDTRGQMFNQEPSAREVYDVLCVFSKYQIPQAAFYTWMKKWTQGFRNGIEDTTLSKVDCLYAAYKLGDFKSLKCCIRHVAHEIVVNVDDSVRLADGKLVQEALPITDDLVDNILAIRAADLESLLLPFQEALDFFMDAANTEDNKFCKSVDSHGPCNQKMLGSLLQTLVQHNMYPIPTVASYVGNVGSLAKKVSDMNVHGLVLPGLAPHQQRHGNCRLGQDAVAKKIMKNEAFLPLSEQLVEHMYRATKDLGVHRAEQSEFYDYKDMFNKWKDCDDSWLSDDDSGVFDVRDDSVSSTHKISQ